MPSPNLNLLAANESIEQVLQTFLASPSTREDPFHILSLDDIVRKHLNWLRLLPRVKPFYAVKCNDEPTVVKTLALLGTGFDCASRVEIAQVLGLGVTQDRIIYAHPIKTEKSLKFAKDCGVRTMTFDDGFELLRIAECFPEARLVLRIRYDSRNAVFSLGKKFGCDPVVEAPELIRKAQELGLNVVGVSFHVGCASLEADCYYHAIGAAKKVFEFARTVGYRFTLLDIGGGYPGDSEVPLDEYAAAINRALDEFFPGLEGIEVIAEPGRYFVGSAVKVLATICGKKVVRDPADRLKVDRIEYYVSDGVFGTLMDWVGLKAIRDLKRAAPVVPEGKVGKICFRTTVWGPTSDATDVICEDVDFPEHCIGEYLLFENVGAYGIPLATNFEGFPIPTIEIYVREDTWNALLSLKVIPWQDKTLDLLQTKFELYVNSKDLSHGKFK